MFSAVVQTDARTLHALLKIRPDMRHALISIKKGSVQLPTMNTLFSSLSLVEIPTQIDILFATTKSSA
jgi:hypothetical protein